MIALLQRVSRASVSVQHEVVGAIEHGLLVLLGVDKQDDQEKSRRLAERVLAYRIFSDADDKMNLDVRQIHGGILVVSQFTLVADTKKGNRPSFSSAASPELGEALYQHFVGQLRQAHDKVETGRFGADMQVELINDGPVTISLNV